MRFFERLFGLKEREPSGDELNAIFVPLRDKIADFKDETKISWLVILPAIQNVALKIILEARGIESASALFSKPQITQYVSKSVPINSIMGTNTPDFPKEHEVQSNIFIHKIYEEMLSSGHKVEHIAQAFSSFSLMIAAKIVDPIYASAILDDTNTKLKEIAASPRRPGGARVVRVSETLSGEAMIEVEPEPVDSTGTPHVSEELAEILRPHLAGRDNIAIRFIGNGLPTTMTAVISEMYIRVNGPPDLLRWYAIRAMIFDTPTGKIGLNVYFKPIRITFLNIDIGQEISDGNVYNFREVYNNIDDSSNDMERLLKIADADFSKKGRP